MGRAKNESSRAKKAYSHALKGIIIMPTFMKGVNGTRMCCGCTVRLLSLLVCKMLLCVEDIFNMLFRQFFRL